MVLEYAEGGNFSNYLSKNYENFDWYHGLKVLTNVIRGLNDIHQKQMIHGNLHTGNILFKKINQTNPDSSFSTLSSSLSSLPSPPLPSKHSYSPPLPSKHSYSPPLPSKHSYSPPLPSKRSYSPSLRSSRLISPFKIPKMDNYDACISDMRSCKKIFDIYDTNIYGVMPYIAPEVLKGRLYTQAADVYSFGMIMYVVATGKQPFVNRAHDNILVLDICNGVKPEINDQIAPKCYINLMKKCWDSNPENRPNSVEIKESIELFYHSLDQKVMAKKRQHYEIIKELFNETQEYRKKNFYRLKITN
jgi:serine/threonine protein kinase